MDKIIKLEMNKNKDIEISVNGTKKITIKKDNRKIQANEIFELLSYSNGDNFKFEIVNDKDYDVPVLKFFCELLNEIVIKLNTDETQDIEDDFNITERECPF
ncbi:hypothetical protein [Anaerococcus sp.]|jgi:hypothetical protein|uniref:hypothetical protein n=2 Tax=Anaerococcus TaxID=165779 RepID=UPI0028FFEFE5|nr:hypothetical protein [Anaerococcus sp.]MDU2599701.1 hypothetical protein [Anaerococcus sp.]MDU3177709.1 hypothetical protein [Anaerococcus sp.]